MPPVRLLVTILLAYFIGNSNSEIKIKYGVLIHETTEGLMAYIYKFEINSNTPLEEYEHKVCWNENLLNGKTLNRIDLKLSTCLSNILSTLNGVLESDVHFEFIGKNSWREYKKSSQTDYDNAVKDINEKYSKFSQIDGRDFFNLLELKDKMAYTLVYFQSESTLEKKYDGFISYDYNHTLVAHNITESTEIPDGAHKLAITWNGKEKTYVVHSDAILSINSANSLPFLDIDDRVEYVYNCGSSNRGIVIDLWRLFVNERCRLVSTDYLKLYPNEIYDTFNEELCKPKLLNAINNNENLIYKFCDTSQMLIWNLVSTNMTLLVYNPLVDIDKEAVPSTLTQLQQLTDNRCRDYRTREIFKHSVDRIYRSECILLNFYLTYLKYAEETYNLEYTIKELDEQWLYGLALIDERYQNKATISASIPIIPPPKIHTSEITQSASLVSTTEFSLSFSESPSLEITLSLPNNPNLELSLTLPTLSTINIPTSGSEESVSSNTAHMDSTAIVSDNDDDDSESLSKPTILGIAFGISLLLFTLIILAFVLIMGKKKCTSGSKPVLL